MSGYAPDSGAVAEVLTFPLLYSTEAAFFLSSVANAPATVAATVLGGMCRRPGPRVNIFFLPVPLGSAWCGILSPGRTSVASAAMARELQLDCCLSRDTRRV